MKSRWLKYSPTSGNIVSEKDAVSVHSPSHLSLEISPRKIAIVLTLVVFIFIFAHIGSQYVNFFLGHDRQFGFARQLNLNNENNMPTWYSSSALLFSSALLAMIGFASRRKGNHYTVHWLGLSVIFCYLSLDEAASLHERTGSLIEHALESIGFFNGFLYYAWVIFGALFVLMLALVYTGFLVTLPARTRYLFLSAGTLYVGGAIGIEMLGGRHHFLYGADTFGYAMFVAIEEGLEMMGIVVFIYALLAYLSSSFHSVTIQFNDETPIDVSDTAETAYQPVRLLR